MFLSVASLAVARAAAAADNPPEAVKHALTCDTPDEAKPGEHVIVRCKPKTGLRVASLVVHVRQPGQEDYLQVPALKVKDGWWQGDICPHVFTAKVLQYYFEARDINDEVLALSGDEESPHQMFRAAPVVVLPTAAAPGLQPARATVTVHREEEDPLALIKSQHEANRVAEIPRRPVKSVFVGLGAGAGYGWHPSTALDFRNDIQVSQSTGAAGTALITPEIGIQINNELALSLQARYEIISSTGSGDLHDGAPPKNALAVMARASYTLVDRGRLQVFGSGSVGIGSGFRLVVSPQPDNAIPLLRNDSVRSGPLVFGPGAGVEYHFSRSFSGLVEMRALAGLPNFGVVGDLGTGVRVAF